jgi:hypothetical protein
MTIIILYLKLNKKLLKTFTYRHKAHVVNSNFYKKMSTFIRQFFLFSPFFSPDFKECLIRFRISEINTI